MYKHKLPLVIAALMITSMAVSLLSISTTTVSATHARTASISLNRVKSSTNIAGVLENLLYPGGDNAVIKAALGYINDNLNWDNNACIKMLDENLYLNSAADNLKAMGSAISIPLRDYQKEVLAELPWIKSATDNINAYGPAENAAFRNIQALILLTPWPSDNIIENANIIKEASENRKLKADNILASATYIKTRALESYDIGVDLDNAWVRDNAQWENWYAENMIENAIQIKGAADNIIAQVDQIIAAATAFPTPVLTITNSGPAGIVEVMLIRPGSDWALDNIVGGYPAGWTENIAPGNTRTDNLRWYAAAENAITGTATFQFSTSIPFVTGANEENHDWKIRTKDTAGVYSYSTFRMIVDNKAPTVTVSVSPSTAKAENVTITVTADEPLSKMDKVTVTQKGASGDNIITVTMSPDATRKVWTGTYSVIPATSTANYDNAAQVVVDKDYTADNVGVYMTANVGGSFWVDTIAPPQPNNANTSLTALPENDNQPSKIISGVSCDNVQGNAYLAKAGMTVTVTVNGTPYTTTSGVGGAFSQAVLLDEGLNTVGVKFTDNAGNEGAENVQTITIDTVKPTITLTSIGGRSEAELATKPTRDNTPSIVLTITDATLGVKDGAYDAATKGGYAVRLYKVDGSLVATLVNSVTYTNPNSISFENTYHVELPDNTYRLDVLAGDNFQDDNKSFTFRVDTQATAVPTPAPGENPLAGYTSGNPKVLSTTALTLSGSNAEAFATIKVYAIASETLVGTGQADSTGRWTVGCTLPASGVTYRIEVTQTDNAGNESPRYVYGYAMVDDSKPLLTITPPATPTDKASVTLTGTLSIDSWETLDYFRANRVTIQAGAATPGYVTAIDDQGKFTTGAIQLTEGLNTITITAIDAAGNVGYATVSIEKTVAPLTTYAIIIVIVALILAAIAIFVKR